MGPMARVSVLTLVVGIAPCVTCDEIANAQQPAIKRTELLKTDLAGMEGKEMNLWTADLAPGRKPANTTTPRPVSLLCWKVQSCWRWKVNRRRPSRPVKHSKSRLMSYTTSAMRARQSRPKLLESSMREKDSLSRSMTASVSSCQFGKHK
jgi:hypothetical protein